jgi:8-oxo-dGTP pyrophosphatase MutT (NUDIX family)
VSAEVRAAGGLIWRRRQEQIEVVVVHRPKYDDWTFPKGKLEPDESDRSAARREVVEETGIAVELGPELVSTTYLDRLGRPKVVRYWAMTATGVVGDTDDEVDEVAWLVPDAVRDRLSYARDVLVLDSLLETLAVERPGPGAS